MTSTLLRFFCFLFPAIVVISAGGLRAKDTPLIDQSTSERYDIQRDADYDEKIRLARRLISEMNYEGAAAFLETLYEAHRDDPVVINLLKQCYEKLQLYPKVEELIKRHLEIDPANLAYRLSYAETLVKLGRKGEAMAVYDSAAAGLEPPGEHILRLLSILQSMMANNLDEAALEFIDLYRARLSDSLLFSIQRGRVLERTKKYKEALNEYYWLLADTSVIGNDAERQIVALLDFVDSSPAVEKELLKKTDLYSQPRALRILSSFYLKAGRYNEAFQFTVSQDSLEGFKGGGLVNFMRNCSARKLYHEAVRMGDYILTRYQDPVVVLPAFMEYGEALALSGRYDDAIRIYDTLFSLHTQPRDKAETLYRLGELYLTYLRNYDKALTYFDSVVVHHQNGLPYLKSLKSRPICYLKMGRLTEARANYAALQQQRLHEDVKEEVDFNLALLYFFEKKFDSSRTALNKLIVDFPRGFFFNDAMKLLMVMDAAASNQAILYDYSNVLLFDIREQEDSTLNALDKIALDPSRVLADVALLKLAEMKLGILDTTAAVTYLDRLIEQFPDSYYMPYGMKQKADLLTSGTSGKEEARKIYRLLLEKYPNYPFTSEVRKVMRALDQPAGEA